MTSNNIYHYVYRITNLVENKHYYGKRSTKTLPHLDLGHRYFSSAKDKSFIQDQKNNPTHYKYKIIFHFDSVNKAVAFEIRLHNKFNVGINLSFYNQAKQTSIGFNRFGVSYLLSDEQKDKIREGGKRGLVAARKKVKEMYPHSAFYGKSHSDETKKKIGLASKNKVGEKNGAFGKIWITNGIESKMVLPNTELPVGWRKGNLSNSSSTKFGKGINHPQYGTILINDGIKNKRIKKDDIIPEGWNKGRLLVKK